MTEHARSLAEDPSGEQRTRTPEPPKPPTDDDRDGVTAAKNTARVLTAITALWLPLSIYICVEARDWAPLAILIFAAALGATLLAAIYAAALHITYKRQTGIADLYARLTYDRHRQFATDCAAVEEKNEAAGKATIAAIVAAVREVTSEHADRIADAAALAKGEHYFEIYEACRQDLIALGYTPPPPPTNGKVARFPRSQQPG